ncbi:myo-inositol 2-dehydrogenase [Thermosporothrix hazakensis]|uniref:Myo-inositol 2-dehydrogenase n=1 Tax=Thermosporothrix hazakensis TaxID=644383 RepID=A0A326U7M3_THEHA|nr:inositol 2-dehydrogenase [Thermosporothrix hazakensis]PZW29289.1 myo-inositol 2-dehydrogenase [Thermosporothrix hazakensis]GCE45358.1 inositol 2-dehydrogenase [Thermosporothrix hazakensis]
MTTRCLQVGVIGAGRIGCLHVEHLTTRIPSARLLMVADISGERAQQCAERFGIPAYSANYQDVIQHPEIQAVVICSSTHTHAQLIQEAAKAGKHIFCEKPLALDLETIDQIVQTVKQAGVQLQVGFNRRFDANYARVRRAIMQGEIGEPRLLHIISRDPAPPPLEYLRTSGGLFLDMAIHDFDMVRYLMGAEVEEVYVQAARVLDSHIAAIGDIDAAITVLRCTNGAIATIDNSRSTAYGYDQRVEVLGSAGAIHTDNRYPNAATLMDAHGVRRDLPLHFFLERYAESFYAEMAAFVEALLQQRSVPVNGEDGRAPVALALAAQRSLQERRPVRLDEIP